MFSDTQVAQGKSQCTMCSANIKHAERHSLTAQTQHTIKAEDAHHFFKERGHRCSAVILQETQARKHAKLRLRLDQEQPNTMPPCSANPPPVKSRTCHFVKQPCFVGTHVTGLPDQKPKAEVSQGLCCLLCHLPSWQGISQTRNGTADESMRRTSSDLQLFQELKHALRLWCVHDAPKAGIHHALQSALSGQPGFLAAISDEER